MAKDLESGFELLQLPIFINNSFFTLFLVYKDMGEAMNKHPEADVMINFASLRSAYDATMEALTFPQVGINHKQ